MDDNTAIVLIVALSILGYYIVPELVVVVATLWAARSDRHVENVKSDEG